MLDQIGSSTPHFSQSPCVAPLLYREPFLEEIYHKHLWFPETLVQI